MATIDRPFAIRFDANGGEDELEIVIDFQRALDDGVRQGVTEVMTTFGTLGASGVLAGDGHYPSRASMTVKASEFWPERCHWSFRDVRIDCASACILMNVVHYLPLGRSADRNAAGRVPDDWSPERSDDAPISRAIASTVVSLNIGDLLDDIDVVVEMVEPQADEITNKLSRRSLCGSWPRTVARTQMTHSIPRRAPCFWDRT
jgi:hypothetical protein